MDRLFVTLQYLLPHHLLCRLVYALTRSRRVWLKNLLIRAFVRHFEPRMSEALEPDPLRYSTFNAFFTRALQASLRPIDLHPACVVSPCDAVISMAGQLQDGQLLQAKGHRYALQALLGGDQTWTHRLQHGAFVTLYLAPYDYHRIHMPLAGRLVEAWHVPGRLFSVNAVTAARVPGLFARNERIVCAFEGETGAFAVVLVGALFVGSMSTVWHDEITPWRTRRASAGPAAAHGLSTAGPDTPGQTLPSATRGVHRLRPITGLDLWQPRGAELGRFNMGSTVVLLLPQNCVSWNEACRPGAAVQVGQALGLLQQRQSA